MNIRESNFIEICKIHGFVYNIIIKDHTKPALQKKVDCRCDEFDASLEAKGENYECKRRDCNHMAECIFSKVIQPDKIKIKRPIFWMFHKEGKKHYSCIYYKYNGEILNE